MLLAVIVMQSLTADWPAGGSPAPVALTHFPDRVHAFVWRNWELIPVERLATTIGTDAATIRGMGKRMGLPDQTPIPDIVRRRASITIIRRNWHLLPYDQLTQLLGCTKDELIYSLREDDFLFVKLGNLKPACPPLAYTSPDDATRARENEIAAAVRETFPKGLNGGAEPLFSFVEQLSKLSVSTPNTSRPSQFSPRFCSSYFALYGDPLADRNASPYPDGYLSQLAQSGVNGVWLQAVLYKLAPFPWDETQSKGFAERLDVLRDLVVRAKRYGIGVYLYLNEPRAMPVTFFEKHPELRGVTENDYAAMCTSAPEVQDYLVRSISGICGAVPDLAGFFTITASENLTNCWSHGGGSSCPRCGKRAPAEVIAEVNGLVQRGINQAKSKATLIAWDWGWNDNWAGDAIVALPKEAALMSVSEWSMPTHRGGIDGSVGEYSISVVGPGPRAQNHWKAARFHGLKTIAKIQAGNTWELSAVPYIPAVENVARHAANLRDAHVDGLMLGWTLGGYPSPNLEVVAAIGEGGSNATPDEAMLEVAKHRFGAAAPVVVDAWKQFSAAFDEFPFDGGLVYSAPMQYGPSNLLWAEPTGYHASMVGFPYDDVNGWRSIYPADVFVQQFTRVADGFDSGLELLRRKLPSESLSGDSSEARNLRSELRVAEAASMHFRSTANQAKFVIARNRLAKATTAEAARPDLETLDAVLREEISLATKLYAIQTQDSRIGFESSNQYFYVPLDLVEKVINCRYLLDHWLPKQRARLTAH